MRGLRYRRRRAAVAVLSGCVAALLSLSATAQDSAVTAGEVAEAASGVDTVLRIAVMSDMNERYGDLFHRDTVHAAVARVRALAPDLVLVPGDMVAGQRAGLDYAGMWAAFQAAVGRPLADWPLAVAPGNHDASAYSRYADERAVYANVWSAQDRLLSHPGVEAVEMADYPFRYAFTLGPALIVALDATTREALDDAQIGWLEGVLSRVDEASHPVRILFAHFPLHPLAQGREGDYLLRDADRTERFEALVVEYGVDAWVSGHHHSYYPGRDPATGLLLIGAGCLGGGPRPLIGEEREVDLEDPTERVLVVLEIDRTGVRSVEGYRGPAFGANDRVELCELPARVGEVRRIDRTD